MASNNFDTLFTNARPHIFEKICHSLDYESFKNCLEVSKKWNAALTSKTYQKKAKSSYHQEILEDEKELRMNSTLECILTIPQNTEKVRKLL